VTKKKDFVIATKEICLKVNAEEIVISRDQNTGHDNSIKIDNSIFKMAEQFRYLRNNANKSKLFYEETESRLELGIDCYHSMQNLLSSNFLSKVKRLRYTK
jgi:hypothetical protein